ncbi:MAG TPA: dehydrogenase, partial [Candidatus Cloacimonas acidaminovorans]|nr:dehydrogenase [Candidatus Cloacimonas acidaminovorans]
MMFTDAFRNDAAAKVTGRAKYTDDYKLPDMLYAVPLHSQVASAIIKSIDYSEALKQKGVVAVYTAKDIPGKIKFGQIIKDCHTIINRRIRSAGDVIALVVAETRE